MNNIGCVLFQDKSYNKAINHFEKALSVRKKIDNKIGIAESLECLIESHITIKNFDKAKHYLSLSIDNYKRLGNNRRASELNKRLSSLQNE